jgi:hypothetical protein
MRSDLAEIGCIVECIVERLTPALEAARLREAMAARPGRLVWSAQASAAAVLARGRACIRR